jgi:cytochrome c-type biogenesis protein CcmH
LSFGSGFLIALAAGALGLGVMLALRWWSIRGTGTALPTPLAAAFSRRFRLGVMVLAGLLLLAVGATIWQQARSIQSEASPRTEMAPATAAPSPAPAKGGELPAMIVELKARLAADPASGQDWLLLARAYRQLQQFPAADGAFREVAARLPDDAAWLADWVDTHVMAGGRQWDEDARALLKRALQADPKHVKTLALAGSEAFDRKDYATAIAFWQRMKAAAPAGSMEVRLAEVNIGEAERLISGKR